MEFTSFHFENGDVQKNYGIKPENSCEAKIPGGNVPAHVSKGTIANVYPNGHHTEPPPERPIGILGSGNYGTALAKRFQLAGVKFLLGSRLPDKARSSNASVQLVTYEKVMSSCEVIFLAIPRHSYDSALAIAKAMLAGKVVVDVSNIENRCNPSNALYLQSILPTSKIIKALNTVSAYALENDAYGACRDTYVCGDDRIGREQVMQILREIGLNPIDRGRLNSAVAIEHLPFRFFEHWGTAFVITGCTLVLVLLYYYLRIFWASNSPPKKEKDHLPLLHANRVIAWLALWLLSLTYLPGCIAGFIQLAWQTKYRRFPGWLDRWMKCRKQLGLITLALSAMHMCMSCILMGAEYLMYMVQQIPIPGTKLSLLRGMTVENECSILFAVIALTTMSIVGITSLPSVNVRMSWKEWDFVQRGVGFATLIFSFLHIILYMNKLYDPHYKFNWSPYWKHNMPPATFVMPLLPALVIFLKVVLLLPGVVCYLDSIRSGKVGNGQQKYEQIILA